MKKFFIALALLILLLLSVLYLAVNSPYVVDKVARKFAPEYGFRYELITGNPIKGIAIAKLYYKDRLLARKIHIRINPYTLLEKRVTVSKLQIYDVNVGVLEGLIRDFTGGEEKESTPEESGGGLPVSLEFKNIHLSLLPFERYGVKVDKEELSVDSIFYANDSFSVGKLKQEAETSLGRVELEGTYHKRFLDVEYLAVDRLDVERLLKTIALVTGTDETTSGTVKQPGEQNASVASSKEASDEDLFLPKRIRAKRLWVTLEPFDATDGVHLAWTQLEGHGIDIDLDKSRLKAGTVTADLESNLAQARMRMHVEKEKLVLDEGVLTRVDLPSIMALGSGDKEANATKGKEPASATVSNGSGEIPFVPRFIELRQMRVELEPGELEGIAYRDITAHLERLRVDLKERRVLADSIMAYLDTPMAHLNLSASIDKSALRIKSLQLSDIDVAEILRWEKERAKTAQASPAPASAPVREKKDDSNRTAGVKIPFLPSTLLIDSAIASAKPIRLDALDANRSQLRIGKLRIDLPKAEIEEGRVAFDLESNVAQLVLNGSIRNNRLVLSPGGKSHLLIPKSLYETYKLPLRPEALSPITIEGKVDKKGVGLLAAFSAKRLLASDENASFNVDIDKTTLRFRYDFDKGAFDLLADANVTLPQAPLQLHAKLVPDKNRTIVYTGTLKAPGVKLGDAKIEKLLGSPRIDFEGDLASVVAKLDAGAFKGSFTSSDLKKGLLTLQTKEKLRVGRYVKLPKDLKGAAATLKVNAPIDFASPLPIETNVTLRSNLANLDAMLRYDGNASVEVVTHFPKNSLLKKAVPKLHLAALDPLKLSLEMKDQVLVATLKGRKISLKGAYDLEGGGAAGVLDLAGNKIKIDGKPKEQIVATMHAPSVKRLISSLTDIYKMDAPQLDGDVTLSLKVDKLQSAVLEVKSKQFVPDDSARIKSPIKNIDVVLSADLPKQSLIVKRYSLEVEGMKIFATKPSVVKLLKERILIDALWVNDSLKVTGQYDLKSQKGDIVAKAARFKVIHKNAKLDASIDIKAKIVGEKVDAKGKIIILGGNVMYNIEAKHYASDDDIVIVQHQKKEDESFFSKNVQIQLYIESKKPLLFKQKNVYVELVPQLSIIKAFGSGLQMMGSIQLNDGGYYTFEGKRFVLSPSRINFIGKPTQPLLDINLVYRRHSRTVYITVNGLATEPNLNFSSDPYMPRDQILSFILFDSTESAENAGDMLSMVGGGIAKSILGNIGLKVDTLLVTTEGFEVGKKITKKITILYDQRSEDPKIIVRIQHSKRTETDISIGSESQSVDIIYKREF